MNLLHVLFLHALPKFHLDESVLFVFLILIVALFHISTWTVDQKHNKKNISFHQKAEKERRKAEVRARLEAQAKKKKRGFMTPERKKRLRVCDKRIVWNPFIHVIIMIIFCVFHWLLILEFVEEKGYWRTEKRTRKKSWRKT